ncbi:voltage-dependent calcium channel beta subunit-associated regulatory protein isoform X1 [Sminthopsis crassicaudata]|uniref:voltage-dependent calcium channel beta subunit-associated regulatory protein isoform X1 n=1 Tax=Sminthopsis crassicaudata TaxID=9301 RepID=UPI003D688B46
MSDDLTPWDNITASPTTVSGSVRPQDGSGLLLVLLSVFIGGTLVVLSGALILCRRCWDAHRRYSRASDDPEKTTTTYLDDSQPAQDITIRGDDPECPSSSSYRDVDTERFLATSSTGRRVSFNEAALFEQSRKAQEKGRRYTLTEGDFHHLKNARLTHLHLPPLKIVTIHECDSSENSVAMTPRLVSGSKTSLSIFQPRVSAPAPRALTGHSMCPSSALPGDPYNSTVDTASFVEASPSASTDSGEGTSLDAATRSSVAGASGGRTGEAGPSSGSGPVLQFFTRLRRHASLEGASPYFKMKKWKLEASHRASSLDTRAQGPGVSHAEEHVDTVRRAPTLGSPKRHQFQRQRAASESMEQEDRDPHQTDIIQYIAHTDDVAFQPLAGPASPPPALGRLEPPEVSGAAAATAVAGATGGVPESPQERSSSSSSSNGVEQQQQQQQQQQTVYRDIWSLRASLELYAAASDQSSGNDQDSVRSGDSAGSAGAGAPLAPSHELGEAEAEREAEAEAQADRAGPGPGEGGEAGPRKLLQMDSGYASIEGPGRAGDEAAPATASEKRFCFTSAGRTGTVFDSFEAALAAAEAEAEAGREPEPEAEPEAEAELRGAQGGLLLRAWPPRGQLLLPAPAAAPAAAASLAAPGGAALGPGPGPGLGLAPAPLPRRDYSIDEKTDALFHEFVRHDPQFDEGPRPRHRSRTHARKQWQRTRQHSDPGARAAPLHAPPPLQPAPGPPSPLQPLPQPAPHVAAAPERPRAPLRRGDSGPPDARTFHSPLPRIVSSGDEEAADEAAPGPGLAPARARSRSPPVPRPAPIQAIAEEEPDVPGGPELLLADKVSAGLEDRLFPGWRRRPGDGAEPPPHGPAPVVAAAAPTSPDPSPV